ELRRLSLLRTKYLVAREVHLRFLDGRRHTTVSLLDRVAEEPWALHAHPIRTELVLQRDALTDTRPCGFVAPGVVELLWESEAPDQLLRRDEEHAGSDDRQRPLTELVLGEHPQVRGKLLRCRIHRQVLFLLPDRLAVLRRRGAELERLIYGYGRFRDELVAERDALRDRKSTRLNSSHVAISYAVFCLKKKKRD